MLPRILAGVAAVALIVGAFAIRSSSTSSSDDGPSAPLGSVAGNRIICATDLADHCRAIDGVTVSLEEAGVTADRLVANGELGADTWITTSAWAALVADERQRLGRAAVLDEPAVIASTTVSLVMWDDRVPQLGCAADWACVATKTGDTLPGNDRVRALMPDVDRAIGLVVAADQAASITGRDDFAANDFVGDVTVLARALADGQRDDPLALMRTRGPGEATAVGVASADTDRLSSNFGSISVVDTSSVRAIVVAVGSFSGDQADDLRSSLLDSGWDPAVDDDGLPAGSVLAAVRTRWQG